MLYTAITRASEDVKFIKFKHLPDKSDIEAFKIMRNVIYFTQCDLGKEKQYEE